MQSPWEKHKQKRQMYSLIHEFEIEVVHSPAFPQSFNEYVIISGHTL